jgi:hypothetical protein
MWLLNVKTMKLEGFMADIPKYSILSHCWGTEEVTFQDLASGSFQHLKGYCRFTSNAWHRHVVVECYLRMVGEVVVVQK